jgi:hypothetical protein
VGPNGERVEKEENRRRRKRKNMGKYANTQCGILNI